MFDYLQEEMLQNAPVQWLKCGIPTAGLPHGRLETRSRELNITYQHQCKDHRTANLMTNRGQRTVERKWKTGKYYNQIRNLECQEHKPTEKRNWTVYQMSNRLKYHQLHSQKNRLEIQWKKSYQMIMIYAIFCCKISTV
jgi:hypothetical protein